MWTAKKNIIIPFIYSEKDVISGPDTSERIFGQNTANFGVARFYRPPLKSQLSDFSTLLFDFHIPAPWFS